MKANAVDWQELLSVTVKTYGSLILGNEKISWLKLKEIPFKLQS